jgi:hypothetical protein
MKSIFSKVALASSVAVALGAVATDSKAGIWDRCADNADNCASNATFERNRCYADALTRVGDYHYPDVEVRICDVDYDREMDNCRNQFTDECSG